MSKLTTTWWIIFYKDQLLLKKTDNGFSIPCAGQPPIHISPETNIHEICMLDGHPCKAIAIDYPVEESDKYMMTGLRASYDFIPLKQYQTAGKAAEILHWDRNSRFCPACGTAMEQKAPIMKKCPKCGNEMYPSISTAILVLIRKEDKLLLVHARNFKGTFNNDFASKLMLKGINKKDVATLKDPVDYATLCKLAVDYSDGIVQNSEHVNEDVMNYARQSGKLVLDYQAPDALADACNSFYDQVWEAEQK